MLAGLENSGFSEWVKASWGAPALLSVHLIGMALVIAVVAIVHLRLLGIFDAIPYTSLGRLFPALWAGLVLELVSGAALWVAKAAQYTVDVAFLVKTVLVVAGFVLALVLDRAVRRDANAWAAGTVAPQRLELVLPSLLLWCAVIVFGRLTAFLGALPVS